MHQDISWTLVLDVYCDHELKVSVRLRIKHESFGRFLFLFEKICLQSAHLFQSSPLMVPRRQLLVSWTGILWLIIIVRNIISCSWAPHILLLEHFLVVFGTISDVERIIWNMVRVSPRRIIIHSLWAI